MTRDQIRQVLIDIIQELAPDDDISSIDDNKRIRDQIDLDSMDFLDIIMELRKKYGIQVPEEDYPQFATLRGSSDYLEPLLKDK
ncbi:acyl carrier protein [Candidatus Auribacterota bacterium]